MQIDWWTLGLQAVNVLILVWLLARFLFKPVVAIAERRRQETTAALDSARAARGKADEELARARAQSAELAAAREDSLHKALADVEEQRAQLLERARTEALALRDAARTEIDQQHAQERRQLAQAAGRLAADIAARLLARMPLPEPREFLDGLLAALKSLPAATRADIAASGSLTLRAASAPSATDIEALRSALALVLGQPINLQLEVDEGLVAGLEIRTPHAVVSNHFRADLERIAGELAGDGGTLP